MIEFSEHYEIIVRNRAHYIGPGIEVYRPHLFSNPYHIGPDGSRNEVIQKFKNYFDEKLQNSVLYQDTMIQYLYNLKRDKRLNLICCCSPLTCHARSYKTKTT